LGNDRKAFKQVLRGHLVHLEYADKESALAGWAEFLEVHRQHWPGWEGEIEMRPIINDDPRPDRNKLPRCGSQRKML
jgi:hypothetical protein